MNRVPDSDRLSLLGRQIQIVILIIIGTTGALGLFIQIIVFPFIGHTVDATVCAYSFGMGTGLPIAGFVRQITKE